MPIKHNYTATGGNDGTKQVSVDRWNDGHAILEELDLPLLLVPLAPPADFLSIFAKKIGGRMLLAQMGPSGLDTSLQAHLGGNKVALWMSPGNSTTAPGVFGMNALTISGTAAARIVATTNLLTRMTRTGYVTATTPGLLAGGREVAAKFTAGAGLGMGGFFARYRFGVSDPAAVSGARMFIGLNASTTAPTNVEPSSMINCFGVGQISTSANLCIIYGGVTPATPIDLGVNFPAGSLSAHAYELAMFSPPSGEIAYQVINLTTGVSASGSINTGGPLNSVLMCHQLWRCNNAQSLAVGLDICGIYIETDN